MCIRDRVTGAMTLLSPLLEKAGEEAAKTIGKKVAEKTVEKSFWEKVKRLFIIEDEAATIEVIENKPIATSDEVQLIENKLANHVNTNPEFAAELQAAFGFSSADMFIAEQLLTSIKADRAQLKIYFQERRDASIETEGSYDIMIARTTRRMQKDEKKFLQLVKKS